jgi:CBS domain-containing protein
MNIITFLRDATIEEVVKHQKIQWLSATDTLEDALQMMDAKAVLSAPVIDILTQQIIGVVDMLDIVTYILQALGVSPEIDFDSVPVGYLESLEVDGRLISKTPVRAIVGNATKYRTQPAAAVVEPTRPLQSLVELFLSGVERVLVAENGQVFGLFSQSDMISIIAQSLYLLGQKKQRTIADLNLANGQLFTVTPTTRTLTALKEMCENQVSAVAIVAPTGKLVGNFSASNLKGLTSDEFISLHLSVLDFLQQQKLKDRPLITSLAHKKALHPTTISPKDTLEHAILMMAAARVHRLWVVNDDMMPTGMLSIADLLRVVTCTDMELN